MSEYRENVKNQTVKCVPTSPLLPYLALTCCIVGNVVDMASTKKEFGELLQMLNVKSF
jgi:hypothetical protein